jgi:hypothetical protein
MRLSFPSLPSINQSFSHNGRTWKWAGSRWDVDSVVIKSPYQVAVEAGFQGTEQEWVASLNPTTVAQNAAQQAMANLTESAPATLDTISELAAALGSDPNFATTVTNALAERPKTTISTSAPTNAQGNNGEIWIVVS